MHAVISLLVKMDIMSLAVNKMCFLVIFPDYEY